MPPELRRPRRLALPRLLARFVSTVLLAAGAAACVLPLVWMLVTSLTPPPISPTVLPVAPGDLTLDNYRNVADRVPVLRLLANSVFVCTAVLASQLAVAVPAAYALARITFFGRSLLRWVVLAVLMIPVHAVVLPVYVLLNRLGLIDTYAALILPFVSSALGIFLLEQFFRGIPQSLFDAARVDGLSEWRIAWTIVFPLARPAVLAFAIFSVVGRWNDLFWPLMVTNGLDRAPLVAGLNYFASVEGGADYGGQMAVATIAVLPLLLAFAFAQRHFVDGITLTRFRH